MEIVCPENKKSQHYAFAIWGLASRFAAVRGHPITLKLMDNKFIREVAIDPAAIAMGNLRVDSRPQPIASESKFRVSRIYDLNQPPIAAGDVEELATLADLLLLLKPYF